MDSVKKNFDEMNATINRKIAENGGEFKATIVFMSEWGGVGAMPVKIYGCEPKGYAQYKNGIDLKIKKKGGRNGYSCRLYESKEFAIFDGWHEPEKGMPGSYTCFDKTLFYRIVDSVKAEKLAEQSERLYAQELEAKPKTYIVVGAGNGQYMTEKELFENFEKVGELHDNVRRIELQGAPILTGLCGPMYDGEHDGHAVIRYETRQMYDILSE